MPVMLVSINCGEENCEEYTVKNIMSISVNFVELTAGGSRDSGGAGRVCVWCAATRPTQPTAARRPARQMDALLLLFA